jgi:hypothetical protein
MKRNTFQLFTLICLTTIIACSVNSMPEAANTGHSNIIQLIDNNKVQPPHNFGGWYCPDNLNGFPAVNTANWSQVPVITNRLPTKTETQNGMSLIYVDSAEYPTAEALDMELPRLANYYNHTTKRNDIIIVIQALKIQKDSIVGFRFLDGGNGSARLNEVTFLSADDIAALPKVKFVSHDIIINNNQNAIANVMVDEAFSERLREVFDSTKLLANNWRQQTNLNYHYDLAGQRSAAYADMLFGNFYVQNDYTHHHYTEKFLLLTGDEANTTTLKIVCGPFVDNFETQERVLKAWGQKVKALSE